MGTKNSCKTAAVMGLLGRGPAAEPAPLEEGHTTDLTRTPEIIYAEINFYSGTMLFSAIEIGRRMVELKEKLPHGSFIDEIKKNTTWSRSQINNFMRLFREYGNSNVQAIGHLSPTKALALLALPESEREEFLEETHEINGEEKTVIDMTSRELDKAIKERDEALKAAAQAQAEQSAAEQAREKMAQDMAFVKQQLDLAQAARDEALDRVKDHREAFDAAEREVARLEKELEELRSRPVEVAVLADPAAIEAARKEAEAAMRDKLDEARAAQKKAQDEKGTAVSSLKQAQADLDELRAKLALAEKKTALAGNEDLLLFRTLFEQGQEIVNKLGGVLLKVRPKDPEKAQGLERALLALADKIRGVAAQ